MKPETTSPQPFVDSAICFLSSDSVPPSPPCLPPPLLQAAVGPSIDMQGSVRPQMHECVRQLFGQVAGKLNPRGLRHCFELLGLDFMIDEKGQVRGAGPPLCLYCTIVALIFAPLQAPPASLASRQVFLIEVNTSPALFRAGQYLTELLPRVIEEVVQKAVDVVLPPPEGAAIEQLDGFERVELAGGLSDGGGGAQPSRSLKQSASGRWKP